MMRQRAVSVDLEPRIEDACLKDLGLFCSDKLEKGEVGIVKYFSIHFSRESIMYSLNYREHVFTYSRYDIIFLCHRYRIKGEIFN